MKKIVSIALLVFMLAACFTVFASATNASAEKVNAMAGAVAIGESTWNNSGKHEWARIFDGGKTYANGDDSSVYCDTMFATNDDKDAIKGGTYTNLYNHLGETGKADSVYLAYVTFELKTTYLIESIAIWNQIFYPEKGVANMNCFDGFDLWASKDGKEYTKIVSVTDMVCQKKWTAAPEDPATAYYTETLASPFEAQYITFCLSQPRCFDDAFATANELTAASNVQYYRLTEFEAIGTATGTVAEETTTPAPETTTPAPETTTPAPETTTPAPEVDETTPAPETTTAAPEEEGGCGSSVAILSVVAILAGAACVVAKKRD